ncbi:peptidoglycan-binding protein [Nonomuraea sp. NPDC050536]|uniref:peptidoglycan-binding protein n=1 Tax=Nonomuraea sp. NPDC050536 TaxID=3364366 RepID=UPI0037C88CD1
MKALLVVLIVVIAGAVAVVVADPFRARARPQPVASGQTALAAVRKGRLSSQVNQTGTLSYAAPRSVVNRASGIYTRLPEPGQEIGCGKPLYRVGNTPVVLLCGTAPPYRDLSEGDSGGDVRQLNRALLGSSSGYFGWRTRRAVRRLQDRVGAEVTGELELGSTVIMPGPLRIGTVSVKLGMTAVPGTPLAEATSTGRQVTANLNPAQQAEVRAGDKVRITLPSGRITPGTVSRIGTVAASTSTVPVYIALRRPRDARALDHAPVQLQITTGGVQNALIVPVTALVVRAGGGYAVETEDHRLVPVRLGLFDDADGLVQVLGDLAPGQHVVVPAT